MHAYYSNYILQDLNEVFLPTYCISQLWPVYLLRGRSLLKVALRTKDLRRRVCNQVISFDIQIHQGLWCKSISDYASFSSLPAFQLAVLRAK
jgi:hypothetical protein